MAELKTLTLGNKKYDSFPGRPYYVDVMAYLNGDAEHSETFFTTEEKVENLVAAMEAGIFPILRVHNIYNHEVECDEWGYYILSLVWTNNKGKRAFDFDLMTHRYILTETEGGGFTVTAEDWSNA